MDTSKATALGAAANVTGSSWSPAHRLSGSGAQTTLNITCKYTMAPDDIKRITWDDATWILTSSFIIFTMQSGFGLLESGVVSTKNEVNIMVKNAVDVIFGGISFWMFGFGFAFGDGPGSNGFMGIGHFLVDASDKDMGWTFSWFIFHLSFSTTATTIVSGAMAERTKLTSYIVFSFLNTLIYCFPAHWIWSTDGFLTRLGAIDVAGAGAVHMVGGVTGLVATVMLKPRLGRFDKGKKLPPMGCPTNALLGMFMLWWGWLGFNCGSTFGISGGKWKLAARSAVSTVVASMGGGAVGMICSYIFRNRKFEVTFLVNGILGSLVGITGICALSHPWESIVIGACGGGLAVGTPMLLNKLKVDDPVGVIPVHVVASLWAMLAVGLFVEEDKIVGLTKGNRGLLRGGNGYLLGVQTLACVCFSCWAALTSFVLLKSIDLTLGLRISPEEEMLGSDLVEHGIGSENYSDTDLASKLAHVTEERRSSLGYRHWEDRSVPPSISTTQHSIRNEQHHSGFLSIRQPSIRTNGAVVANAYTNQGVDLAEEVLDVRL